MLPSSTLVFPDAFSNFSIRVCVVGGEVGECVCVCERERERGRENIISLMNRFRDHDITLCCGHVHKYLYCLQTDLKDI